MDGAPAEYPHGDQHRAPDTAPLPRMISQPPGGRSITLDHFHRGRSNVWFLWEQTLGMDLPSLHTMFLSKLPSVALQNALSTIMAFRTALLLIKKLTSRQTKWSHRPVLTEFLEFLPCFPPS